MDWTLVILCLVICGFVCEYLGNNKGQKGCFLYGLLLGFLGIIIVLCLKDKSSEMRQNNMQNTNNSNLNESNKYEQLAKIQELKEKGALTEEEFKLEKEKILR